MKTMYITHQPEGTTWK